MKKMKLKYLFTGLFAAGMMVAAGSVSANEFSFSVNPVLPANQATPGVAYYDLLLQPGQTQTVNVTLTNDTPKEVTVDISLASATTNLNGVVEYSPNSIKADKSLKYDITKFGSVQNKVELAPNSSQTVPVKVTMPNATFNGKIAGGLTFKQDSKQTEASSTDKKGISIKNEFQYVVALLMRQNTTPVAPVLNLTSVQAGQVNYRNVVNANYENTAMDYLKDMTVDAKVTAKGGSKALYTINKSMMEMAPNTNFDMPMELNGQAFKPGTYTYTSTVYGQKDPNGKYVYGKDAKGADEHYDYKWTFAKDFTISGQQATNYNKTDVTLPKQDNTWLYVLIGVLIAIILFFIFFLLLKRRKKDDEEE